MLPHSAMSHRGRVRAENQDAVMADPDHGLYVVADGVGGLPGGRAAAEAAAGVLHEHGAELARLARRYHRRPRPLAHATVVRALDAAFDQANRRVRATGPGATTIAAVLVTRGTAFIAHVGDSRAWLYRERHLLRLTEDHGTVNELLLRGLLSAEEARRHPRRNVITRAVGADTTVVPDILSVEILRGDRLLLATDGLCDMVDERSISALLRDRPLPGAAADLVTAALAAGGRDNVSVVVVDAELAWLRGTGREREERVAA